MVKTVEQALEEASETIVHMQTAVAASNVWGELYTPAQYDLTRALNICILNGIVEDRMLPITEGEAKRLNLTREMVVKRLKDEDFWGVYAPEMNEDMALSLEQKYWDAMALFDIREQLNPDDPVPDDVWAILDRSAEGNTPYEKRENVKQGVYCGLAENISRAGLVAAMIHEHLNRIEGCLKTHPNGSITFDLACLSGPWAWELHNKQDLCQSLHAFGDYFDDLGEIEKAVAVTRKAAELCMELGHNDRLGYLISLLALRFIKAKKVDEAKSAIRQALPFCNDQFGSKANLLQAKAQIAELAGDMDSAIKLRNAKERYLRENDRLDLLALLLKDDAYFHRVFKNDAAAKNDLQMGAQLYHHIGNISGLHSCLYFLGLAAFLQGNHRKAAAIFRGLARISQNTDMLRYSLGQLYYFQASSLCYHLGKQDEALPVFQMLEEWLAVHKRTEPELLKMALVGQTHILFARGADDALLGVYPKVIQACKDMQDMENTIIYLNNYATSLITMGNPKQAMAHIKEALSLLKGHAFPDIESTCRETYQECLAAMAKG